MFCTAVLPGVPRVTSVAAAAASWDLGHVLAGIVADINIPRAVQRNLKRIGEGQAAGTDDSSRVWAQSGYGRISPAVEGNGQNRVGRRSSVVKHHRARAQTGRGWQEANFHRATGAGSRCAVAGGVGAHGEIKTCNAGGQHLNRTQCRLSRGERQGQGHSSGRSQLDVAKANRGFVDRISLVARGEIAVDGIIDDQAPVVVGIGNVDRAKNVQRDA